MCENAQSVLTWILNIHHIFFTQQNTDRLFAQSVKFNNLLRFFKYTAIHDYAFW